MSGPFLGLDLGTSGLKGVLVDDRASVLAEAQAAYRTLRPEAGRAEQRPADWIGAVERVCATLAHTLPPKRWSGIGLSGMIPTLVLADEHGEALGTAITWEDSRAEVQANRLRRLAGARALYRTTGQWVDGRYLLPMWMWVAEHDPERARRARFVLGAKDHLVQLLTGEAATDPSTATGLGCFDLSSGGWDRSIAALAGIGTGRRAEGPVLPKILPSTSTLTLGRDAAGRLGLRQGVPVTIGAADSVLSADALGLRTEEIAYSAGTSTVMMSLHDDVKPDARHRYLITPASRPGRWCYEMDLLSTGSAVRWLGSVFGLGPRAEGRVLSLAERAGPQDDLVFLPYVAQGEQGALWDPALRGAVEGLTLRHGPAEIARALVDGIVLESRRCVSVLRAKGAAPIIRATGGMTRSRWFLQRLADATGCDIARSRATFRSAVGAAALCDEGLGEALAAGASDPNVVVHHDPSSSPAWNDRWARHEDARHRAMRAR
jgi:sugar (pentulose or hexulose) kinase